MKKHLARTITTQAGKITGMACVRDIHKKGRALELADYAATPENERCHHCDNIARKITSYI